MQPAKQLKVQYIGIFEEIDSFYWPKMHFSKKGQKIRPPPSFGQCLEENVFFSLMSSQSTNINFYVSFSSCLCFRFFLLPTIKYTPNYQIHTFRGPAGLSVPNERERVFNYFWWTKSRLILTSICSSGKQFALPFCNISPLGRAICWLPCHCGECSRERQKRQGRGTGW